MEGLQVVKSLIQQGDFMMKLDLKDAYYTLPIHPSHRKYLRFFYEDRTYEFQCLPFGLSSAPRAFTKTLKPVLALLQSMGIRVVIYIDDMLLLHQQHKVLQKIFAQVVDLLEKLGFLVKREKCSPIPCQRLIFLGSVLDSTTMTVPPSTKTYHHCVHLPSPPCSRAWLSEDSVHVNLTNEPCIANRDLGCTTSLQRSSTSTPASSVTSWAGRESGSPLNPPGTERPRVVGLREQLLSEWLSNSAPTYRSHSLKRCLKTGLGRSLPGDFHRGPLEFGRG